MTIKHSNIILRIFRKLQRIFIYYCTPRALWWNINKTLFPRKEIIIKAGNGLKLRTYPFEIIGRELFIRKRFEREVAYFINSNLKPGMTAFDIGANCGLFTLAMASCVGKAGKVYSFEPSLRMYSELDFNIKLNGLEETCVYKKIAISDKNAICDFPILQEGQEVYGSVNTMAVNMFDIVGYEEVKTVTLDGFLKTNNIAHVDFIKLDIEGAELHALKGASQLLSSEKPPMIAFEASVENIEMSGYQRDEIWSYLNSFGYEIYRFDKKYGLSKTDKPILLEHNYIAMKNTIDA